MAFELIVSGLSKTYPNGVQALADVSLTIPAGMFGLLGPNGAGKSTLMRTLATLQDADAGSAHLGTIDVLRDKDAVRRTLGYLPQDFGVYPKVSAEDLLDHLARLKGLAGRGERRDVVAALLRQTNLYDVRKKALGGYSGGMRQRFGIAQALLGNPRLIIVDEPTAGLDPEERVRFHNLLAEIGENVIVLLSTHIVSDVSDLCGRMAIINQGRVLLTGRPQELVASLEGRVWQKAVARSELAAVKAALPGDLDAAARRPHAGEHRRSRLARRRLRAGHRHARGRLFRGHRRSPRADGSRPRGRLMRNLVTIAAFEFRTRLKRISTWVYFAIFFALAMLWIAAAGGAVPGAIVSFGSGKVWINSPYAVGADRVVPGDGGADGDRGGDGPRGAAGLRIPDRRVLLHRADPPLRLPRRPLRRRARRAHGDPFQHRARRQRGTAAARDRPGPRRTVPPRRVRDAVPYDAAAEHRRAGRRVLLRRGADPADAAGLHRQRAAADRLPRSAGPAARHRQQASRVARRSVRADRQLPRHRVLVDQREKHAAAPVRGLPAVEPPVVARRRGRW